MSQASKTTHVVRYVLTLVLLAALLGVLSEIVLNLLGGRAQAWRSVVFAISTALLLWAAVPLIVRRRRGGSADETDSQR
ncbi:MAG: hypothetical protein H0U23_00165 [Blastocatellia bacterium]|nr:hypothetical protein [Blastocatellia bacterium]